MSEVKRKAHLVFLILLLLFGLFVIVSLIYSYTQADTVQTQTTINNENPEVYSIYVSSSANGLSNDYTATGVGLISGGSKEIHINGVVSDANGANDINEVSAIFYRQSIGDACSLNNNNCYQIATCALSADTSSTKKYDCSLMLQFYADSTDEDGRFPSDVWKSKIIVNDLNSGTNNATSSGGNDVEVNSLLSLGIPASITWNQITTNNTTSTTSTNVEMSVTQKGNDEADVEVSGTALNCSGTGSIPVGNVQWSLDDVDYNGAGTNALTDTAADTNLGVGYRENDEQDLTKTITWNIAIPYEAVGTCSGTNTINAISA